MFGLLKSCSCKSSKAEKQLKRSAYCGSCKALGTLYGQKSRLILNHDATFLAELLLALKGEVTPLPAALRSYNCMSLPASDEIPLELQISSSINMILLEFKLLDRIEDSRGIISEFAYRAFSANFAKAAEILGGLNFPIANAFAWLKVQSKREKSCADPDASHALPEPGLPQLLYYAEATSAVTACFFKQAAIACKHLEHAETFAQIGESFGNLIYILDALEDRQADVTSGAFNGITKAYNLDDHLNEEAKAESVHNIFNQLEQICSCLQQLPLPQELQQQFQQRFRTNVKQRLTKLALTPNKRTKKHERPQVCSKVEKAPAPIISSQAASAKTPSSFATRIQRDYTSRRLLPSTIEQRLVFAYAYAFAMILGTVAHEAETFSDCLELPFNLIFLSAVAKQVTKELFLKNQLIGAHAMASGNALGAGSLASIGMADEEFRKKAKDPSDNSNSDLCDCCDPDCCGCCNGSGSACCDCGACDCSACDCGACHHSGSCCDCAGGGCDCSGCASGGCDCGSCDCGGCDCGGGSCH